MRLIERASLDEISRLPTERIAGELPDLISDVVGALAAEEGADPYKLSEERAQRAASLASLRGGGRDAKAADLARDVSTLQAVLIRALREELADDPDAFADAVELLADATGAIHAAAAEALVRHRSRELESQANTDTLTGLANLRALQRRLAEMLEMQRRYGHPFAVLLMDVDGLKRINDSHGHQAGDRVLMQVAMAVRRSVRTVDLVARLGGDEFCVLAPEQDLKSAAVLAERLSAAVNTDVISPGEPPVGMSVGVAACPDHGDTAEALLDTADRAMYTAKAAGDGVAVGEPPPAEFAEEAKT